MKTFLSVVLLLSSLGCGPLIMIPGGQLAGQAKPAPDDWGFSDAIETVQLETRPADPYSVNVWGVGVGPVFYVAAGEATNRWAQYIDEDPNVRLKLGEDVFELRAVATEDPADLELFLAGVKRKYDFEPDAEQRDKSRLFRLLPRN